MLKSNVQKPLFPILAVDFGYRHMGVAVSDPQGKLAMALTQLHGSQSQAILDIEKIVQNYKIRSILVGMPVPAISEQTQLTKDVEQFIAKLKQATDLEINTFDELLTSKLAGGTKNNHAGAARIILQGYLDTLHETEPTYA